MTAVLQARFGPFGRWGSLTNVLFVGTVIAVYLVSRARDVGGLPSHFPILVLLLVIFLSVAVVVWWRHYTVPPPGSADDNDPGGGGDEPGESTHGSPASQPGHVRALTPNEAALVWAILESATIAPEERRRLHDQAISAMWTVMDDGGMGSLSRVVSDGCAPRGLENPLRSLGEVFFDDVDGVSVSAVLSVDGNGCVHELDLWKSGFEALIELPDRFSVE